MPKNNMTTPIFDFVKNYANSDVSRFHMPGHKGKSFLGCESLDITEISGADVLGAASGIIAQSEQNAASLFGSAYTFYSTEGSSLCIKAMLALVKRNASDKKVRILASRNVHKAFIYACALLDVDVDWIHPKNAEEIYSYKVTPKMLELKLKDADTLPDAFYLTSPDYLGNMSDIKGIADVCHKYGIPFLVDNAHGAYLAFLEPSLHPLTLGADMCCDSAHKTLPVLTGGAYLHVSKNYDINTPDEIRNAMSLFASTSPSYLILQSLDLCNAYLADGYKERLKKCADEVAGLKLCLGKIGFPPNKNTEPLKIVLSKSTCGYSGNEMAQALSEFDIEVELADENDLVLMITPENTKEDFKRLIDAFLSIPSKKSDNKESVIEWQEPVASISIRDAIFSKSETIPTALAQGRICAAPAVAFPPAIPVVVSGELITKDIVDILLYYNIEKVDVIK